LSELRISSRWVRPISAIKRWFMADKKSKWRLYTSRALKCKGLKIMQLPKGQDTIKLP